MDSSESDKEEVKDPKDPDPKTTSEEEVKDDASASSTKPSATSAVAPQQRSCCYRFWNAIFKFFAHDSIYGSFVGPHPVAFVWCCCKCCCKEGCVSPFALASIATKLMWFIMMIVIIILSLFMIQPYGTGYPGYQGVADFYPCKVPQKEFRRIELNNLTRDCRAQGGYYMVYRNFLAFDILLLISCFIMINVKSTEKNRKRAKMHHGFWMYKYIILFVLLLTTYCAIRMEGGAVLEYTMSWLGLLGAFIFSFVEVTFLLDLVELFCESNHKTEKKKNRKFIAKCWYWTLCSTVLMLDCVIIGLLCTFYVNNDYQNFAGEFAPDKGVNGAHLGIIISGIILSLSLFIVGIINCKRKLFKYTGMMQTSIVILYVLCLILVGLGSSPQTTARPKINKFLKKNERSEGNRDTQFKPEALLHGLCSFLALVYYVFCHGPRSSTAPMSVLFDKIFFSVAKKSEVPVIPIYEEKSHDKSSRTSVQSKDAATENVKAAPVSNREKQLTPGKLAAKSSETAKKLEGETESEESSSNSKENVTKPEEQKEEGPYEEYSNAIKEFKVYDDEKQGVRYSWSMFYVFMILGSLSIMSGMTALSTPWAIEWYSSSYEAMGMKLGMAVGITLLYIFTTTFPCPKVFAESCENPQCTSGGKTATPSSAKANLDPEKGEASTESEA